MQRRYPSTLLVTLMSLVSIVMLVTITISSCSEDGGRRAARVNKPTILLVLNVNNNEFFRKIEEGFRNGMTPEMKRDYQVDVEYCLKPSDVAYQSGVMEHYYADYVSGLKEPALKAVVIAPAGSSAAMTSQIKKLRDGNIPVVIVDRRIERDALAKAHIDYSAFIGSQNRDGGVLAADQMARCLPEGGDILILNGVPGMEAARDRRLGFTSRLAEISKESKGEYKITERTADFLRSEAQREVGELLSTGEKFDGIFAANDEMALGAMEALHAGAKGKSGAKAEPGSGQTKTVIIGFDGIQEAVKAVKDGQLAATIAQDPMGMGQKAAETIEKLFAHQEVEKEQILPPTAVTLPVPVH